jgi:hypothetical protein
MRLAEELSTDLKLLALAPLGVRTPERGGDGALPPGRLADRDQAVQLAEQRGDLLVDLAWPGVADLADLHERVEERRSRRPELVQGAEQDRHVLRAGRLVEQQGLLQRAGHAVGGQQRRGVRLAAGAARSAARAGSVLGGDRQRVQPGGSWGGCGRLEHRQVLHPGRQLDRSLLEPQVGTLSFRRAAPLWRADRRG